MRRSRFGGHIVEIDLERGTISWQPAWYNLLSVLVVGCVITLIGVVLIYGAFYGEPAIPRNDRTTLQWWAYMALYAVFLAIGFAIAAVGARFVLYSVWCAATGCESQVLDRKEGRCRQGNESLFELDQVVSVGVEYFSDGDTSRAGVRFIRKDGSSHTWLASFAVRKWQCSDLAREVASFLGVPLDGEEDGTKKPFPERLAEWPEIA